MSSNTIKMELGSEGINTELVERCSAQAVPMLHVRCVHMHGRLKDIRWSIFQKLNGREG